MGPNAGVKDWRTLGLLLLLTLGITLPFVTQAFHIDDPTFIAIARQIVRDPWRPYSFSINWLATERPAFEVLANPPLIPAYIALVTALLGEREVVLHLAFIPIALLATWGVWRCATCFVRHPGIATACYLVTPAFVVSSHTLMPDIALVALASHAVASFVSGFRDRRSGQIALGATLAGMACLTRYNGLVLIPLFLITWWVNRKRNGSQVAWVALPISILGLWSLHNILVYGSPHLLSATSLQGSPLPYTWRVSKAIATASYLGAAALFPLALFPIAWKHGVLKIGLLLGVGIGAPAAFVAGGFFSQTLPVTIALAVLLAAFSIYVAAAVHPFRRTSLLAAWQGSGGKTTAPLLLAAWFAGTLLFNQFLLFAAVRYLLPAILPATLLLVRVIEESSSGERALKALCWAGVLTLGLSVGLSVGDMKAADVGRQFGRALAASTDLPSGTRWFVGHWGFQYYMERGGARALGTWDTSPHAGDLLVVSEYSVPHGIQRSVVQRLTRLSVIEVPTKWPLRTISARIPAFFHANFFITRPHAFLPYGLSTEPLDRILVFRVGSTP